MFKSCSKFVCALLAVLLVFASVACLAETVQRTYYEYEKKDANSHYVHYETWEYTVKGGEEVSGHPTGDEGTYTEPHSFSNGVCTLCGYKKPAEDEDEDKSSETETVTETETETVTETTFTTASGITVTVGAPADETLKQVFAAIPANTEVTISGVDSEVADQLIKAINEGTTPEELLEILANFPQQIVDGTPCYVVSISYIDAAGNPVAENYAFSTEDGSLVKVF